MKRKQITAFLLAATMVSGQVAPAFAEEAIVGVEATAEEEEGALVEEEPVDGFEDEVIGDDFVGEEADGADLGGDLIEDAESADDGFVADGFEDGDIEAAADDGELDAAAGDTAIAAGSIVHISGNMPTRCDLVQSNVTFILDGDTTLDASFGTWQQQDGLVFDLNGHTLTIPTGNKISAGWGTHVTIKDTTGSGKVVGTSEQVTQDNGGFLSITGGTFQFDPSEYTTDTVKKNTDGTWTVGAEEETEPETPAVEPVVKIGEKGYATLQEAFDAAKSGDVLKLVSTINGEDNLVFPAGVKATIDFAGNTVNIDSAAGGQVKIYGDLTVKDSTGSKGIFTNVSGMSATDALVLVDNGGALTFSGKTAGIMALDDTTFGGVALEVKDGTFTCNDEGLLSGGDTALIIDKGGKAVINSTNLMCMALFSGADCVIVNGGELDVTGGEITGPANAINVKSGKLVVSGGAILSSQGGESVVAAAGATVEISGGIFSQEVKPEWCAAGYAPAANEDEATKAQYPYTVAKAVGVATIGTSVYKTLQEAFTAAKDGDKITLIDDLTSEKIEQALKVPTGKSVSLDLAGHTLGLGSDANDAGVLTVDGGLTLLDSVGRAGILSAYVKDAMIVVNGTLDVKDDVIVMAIDADTFGGTCIKANSGAVVTIENGDVSAGDAVVDVAEGATLNVKGGLLMNSSFTGAAVVKTSGTTNIEGGQVIGLGNGVEQNAGTLNISGGQIKSTGGLKTFVINGGETAITGGVFGDAVDEAWCPEGYAPAENTAEDTKEDYPYTVEGIELVYVAAIGDKQFTTLQKAIDAAKSGDTITILKAINLISDGGATVPEGLKITIDTAAVDYNYQGAQNAYAIAAAAAEGAQFNIYGEVTLTDSNPAESRFLVLANDDAALSGINVYGNGKLTLNKCAIYSAGGLKEGNMIGLHDNAELIVNAEKQDNYAIVRSQHTSAVLAEDNSKITLTMGVLWNIVNKPAVILNDNASMTIDGIISVVGGKLTQGGFVRSGGATGYNGAEAIQLNGKSSLTQSGGRIRTENPEGTNFKKSADATVAVSGGFLKQELLEEDCAPGYEPTTQTVDENGVETDYWTVEKKEIVFAELKSAAVEFAGAIGLRFNINVPDDLKDVASYAEVTMNGTTQKIDLATCPTQITNGKVYYVIVENCYSFQTKDSITVRLCDKNGKSVPMKTTSGKEVTDGFEYSVVNYLDAIINKSSNASMKKLAQSLKDYGDLAQVYFAYKSDGVVPTVDLSGVTLDSVTPYKPVVTGSISEVAKKKASFLFHEDSKLIFNFTLTSGTDVNELNFDIDGTKVEPQLESDGTYSVIVKNIYAFDLDKMFKVTVTNASGEKVSIEYSGLSYAYQILSKDSSNVELKNLVKGLYLYNKAADAYFG